MLYRILQNKCYAFYLAYSKKKKKNRGGTNSIIEPVQHTKAPNQKPFAHGKAWLVIHASVISRKKPWVEPGQLRMVSGWWLRHCQKQCHEHAVILFFLIYFRVRIGLLRWGFGKEATMLEKPTNGRIVKRVVVPPTHEGSNDMFAALVLVVRHLWWHQQSWSSATLIQTRVYSSPSGVLEHSKQSQCACMENAR